MTCIPSPVPNYRGVMVVDLAGLVDGELAEVRALRALPQFGVPETVSFIGVSRGLCLSPTSGRRQAVSVQTLTFTLPIQITLSVETVGGLLYSFETCLELPLGVSPFITDQSLVGGPDVLV